MHKMDQKVTPYYLSTNCAKVCARKACFVRYENNTYSTRTIGTSTIFLAYLKI